MIELIKQLRTIDEDLRDSTRYANDLAYKWTVDTLLRNFEKVDDAWCGSWFGYLANVYCTDFNSPTIDMYQSLDLERGAESVRESQKESNWRRYSDEQVDRAIEREVERRDIRTTFEHSLQWADRFRDKKADVLDIINIAQLQHPSIFDSLANSVKELHIQSPADIVERQKRAVLESKDPVANQLAIRIPPHIRYRAKITWSMDGASTVRELRKLIAGIVRQIERVLETNPFPLATGKKVFIGHGSSLQYEKLHKLLEKRLKLEIAEFDHRPADSKIILPHILDLIRGSRLAFILLTGEDKLDDQTLNPRLNVVHELGLCQATLGYENTIILREEGCATLSNVSGIVYISFPKDNVEAVSEKIREALETRGII